ncbi:hypothetical protein ACP70R_049743 [Stipagrostis hirtigluma subsp. patula]
MPSDHPEPLELHAAAPRAAKSGGKMHRLLRSAFKRGDSPSAGSREADQPASESSSSSASSGRPPSGRRAGRRGGDGSVDSDRSSCESFELDGSKNAKLLSALCDAKIGHAHEPFPWEKKMREVLPVAEAGCFLSLLLLPRATDASSTRYNTLDDTLARADAWLRSSQASGVPVVPVGVQTEPLLIKISDLAGMANASLYGFEDYHGVDVGVVRAARLWHALAAGGEAALELRLRPGDTRLGFAVSRTEEGFIHVSSVAEEGTPGAAAARSGLLELHRAERAASRLLVVSRARRR